MVARVSEADVKRLGRAARKQVARQPAPVLVLDQLWRIERHYELRINGCYYHNIRLKPEEVVQFDVMNLLRRKLPEGWIAFHIANEAKRSRFAWAMQLAMGFMSGLPDIIVMGPTGAGFAFVECKAPNGKLTPAQHRFELWCAKSDVPFALISSAQEMHATGIIWRWWRVR